MTEHGVQKRRATPLPVWQIATVLLIHFCEPVAYSSIFPYVNQQIEDLGTEPDQVGYYVGLIESLFFATEAIFVLYWSRLSDRIGRRPVLIIGLLGVALSLNLFGISTTFWALVASRAVSGALNGNIGVCKATTVELTDDTNRVKAFSYVGLIWSAGNAVGPMIGGSLAGKTFPSLLPLMQDFLRRHPYWLSCAAAGAFPIVCSILVLFVLKETRKPTGRQEYLPLAQRHSSQDDMDEDSKSLLSPTGKQDQTFDHIDEDDRIVSLAELIRNRTIQIAILNYGFMALIEMAYTVIFNLFMFTPVELGGLGYQPQRIGVILALQRIVGGGASLFAFPWLEKRMGTSSLYRYCLPGFGVLTFSMPVLNIAARRSGDATGWAVQFLLLIVLLVTTCLCTAYGCTFFFINTSAPTPSSLGATNGLAQTVISVIRATGPAMLTAVFAASVQYQLLGGQLIYVILICIVFVGWWCTWLLPEQVKNAEGAWVRKDGK